MNPEIVQALYEIRAHERIQTIFEVLQTPLMGAMLGVIIIIAWKVGKSFRG